MEDAKKVRPRPNGTAHASWMEWGGGRASGTQAAPRAKQPPACIVLLFFAAAAATTSCCVWRLDSCFCVRLLLGDSLPPPQRCGAPHRGCRHVNAIDSRRLSVIMLA